MYTHKHTAPPVAPLGSRVLEADSARMRLLLSAARAKKAGA